LLTFWFPNIFHEGIGMPGSLISREQKEALDQSERIIRFAAENKAALDPAVILNIQNALTAERNASWSESIASDFWAAYGKLCTLLQPVTVDSLNLSFRYKPRAYAWAFQAVLMALLAATGLALFVAATGDSAVSDINSLVQQGDTVVAEIRDGWLAKPDKILVDKPLDDDAQPTDVRRWIGKLNTSILKLFLVNDQLFARANSAAFRMMGVPPYEVCQNGWKPDCYEKGNLSNQRMLDGLNDALVDYFNHYNTRREVIARKDEAASALQAIKGIFLPALLGMLGACTYVVRNISEQVRDATFTRTSGIRHIVRLLLGSIVGVVVTFLWSGGAPGGISASAVSFIAGYAIETVFALFDAIAQKLK
jgi:hypothetical protein